MSFMIILFSGVLIAEILCLIGLFLCYRWLCKTHKMVLAVNGNMLLWRNIVLRDIRAGRITLESLGLIPRFLGRYVPWWIKGLVTALRWVGKIRR